MRRPLTLQEKMIRQIARIFQVPAYLLGIKGGPKRPKYGPDAPKRYPNHRPHRRKR